MSKRAITKFMEMEEEQGNEMGTSLDRACRGCIVVLRVAVLYLPKWLPWTLQMSKGSTTVHFCVVVVGNVARMEGIKMCD